MNFSLKSILLLSSFVASGYAMGQKGSSEIKPTPAVFTEPGKTVSVDHDHASAFVAQHPQLKNYDQTAQDQGLTVSNVKICDSTEDYSSFTLTARKAVGDGDVYTTQDSIVTDGETTRIDNFKSNCGDIKMAGYTVMSDGMYTQQTVAAVEDLSNGHMALMHFSSVEGFNKWRADWAKDPKMMQQLAKKFVEKNYADHVGFYANDLIRTAQGNVTIKPKSENIPIDVQSRLNNRNRL